MRSKQPLKIGYVLFVLQGLLSVLAPRRAIAVATAAWRLGFENVGDLEPREWYVELTRTLGVGLLVAGLTGLALSSREDDEADDGSGDDASDHEDADGPARVDVD
jgi:hypothetical protein